MRKPCAVPLESPARPAGSAPSPSVPGGYVERNRAIDSQAVRTSAGALLPVPAAAKTLAFPQRLYSLSHLAMCPGRAGGAGRTSSWRETRSQRHQTSQCQDRPPQQELSGQRHNRQAGRIPSFDSNCPHPSGQVDSQGGRLLCQQRGPHGLPKLSSSAPVCRLWGHRCRLQNSQRSSPQAVRHVLDSEGCQRNPRAVLLPRERPLRGPFGRPPGGMISTSIARTPAVLAPASVRRRRWSRPASQVAAS